MTVTEGGRVIAGRYRLMAPLGSGGVGIVWRARDDLLDREVAVKEIARFGTAGGGVGAPVNDAVSERELAESYERTLREARAAARITHPGVAAVYDVVSEGGRPYIVMELIGGRPLSELIADEGGLSQAQVADIGRQVLAALRAGHAAGVLHRDLKPGNVLITPAGRAVLTDFGIASVVGDPSITRTGVVVGTPGYLAPERIKGEQATPAADLWSLGATLYAAACGRGPYDGYDGAIATMFMIATKEPPQPPVGGPLGEIIGVLLRRDPASRPGAAELARALEATIGVLGDAAPVQPYQAAPVEASPVEASPVEASPVEASPVEVSPARTASVPDHPRTVTSELLQPANDAHDVSGFERHGPRPRSRPRSRPRGYLWTAVMAGAAVLIVVGLIVTTTVFRPGSVPKSSSAGQVLPTPVAQQFRVTAVTDPAGGTVLFGVAGNGNLVQDRLSNGSWTGWTTVPAGGLTFAGVPAVASTKDGRLAVFARTSSATLEYLWQTAPGAATWHRRTLGSELVSSDPAVLAWPDGRLEVFVLTGNGHVGTVSQLSAADLTGWSGWVPLGGDLAGPPAAALDSTNHPQVFGITGDGHLQHDYLRNGSWAGWNVLPGGSGYTGVPAVGTDEDGRLEVFARTTSGTLDDTWQLPGTPGQWGGPAALIEHVVTDPAVFNANGGRLEVFAVAAGGKMMHTWQIVPNGDSGWNQPKSLGGDTAGGAPAAIRFNGRSQLFARGPDGKIGYDHLDAPVGTWSGWSGLGGSF